MTGIYLAGKIAQNDWRHSIAEVGNYSEGDSEPTTWGPVQTAFEGVTYVGPFFVGCDHGCTHGGDAHGRSGGCVTGGDRSRTANDCLSQVASADLVFAWLDELTPDASHSSAYGTLVEIGYALALRKPVVVAAARAPYDPNAGLVMVDRHPIDDLWFAWSLATERILAETPGRALERALQRRRNHPLFAEAPL